MIALEAVLTAALTAAGAPAPAAPAKTAPKTGWRAGPASVLFFDASGAAQAELPVGRWEEALDDGRLRRRTSRAGASADGRFAWSWSLTETVLADRKGTVAGETRLFRYFGSNGAELWSNDRVDAPRGLEPAVLADDGETLLAAERVPGAWLVAGFDFTGRRIVEGRLDGALQALRVTPRGRFGWARWQSIDQPPVYSVFDLRRPARTDAPASRFPRGRPRVTDDGKLYDGDSLVGEARRGAAPPAEPADPPAPGGP